MLRKKKSKPRDTTPEVVETDPHHRRPESLGGKFTPENISIVPIKKHRAWHILFRNHPPQVIADIINRTWIDPDFELVLRRRKPRRSKDKGNKKRP